MKQPYVVKWSTRPYSYIEACYGCVQLGMGAKWTIDPDREGGDE